jgi:phage pi2 protein 07
MNAACSRTVDIRIEKLLKKSLAQVKFEDMKGKSFKTIHVTEMLCEVCEKTLGTRERILKRIQILSREDYENLLNRAAVHDRVEIENGKIYFYDHDFPGDVHPECIEKL